MSTTQSRLLLLSLLLIWALWGCEKGPLNLSIRYETLDDLRSKSSVFFEETEVGHVDQITSTDNGDFLVEVSIAAAHKGKATDHSKFFILSDPHDSSRKAVVIEQEPPGGTVLQDGSIVKGDRRSLLGSFMASLKKSTKAASNKLQDAMHDINESLTESSLRFNEQMDKSIEEMDQYFERFENSLNASTSDEELEKLQQAMDDFIAEFRRSSEESKEVLRVDILPKIRKNLEDLREKLLDNDQRAEVERIDDLLNEITYI